MKPTSVTSRVQTIVNNTTLLPEGFGGWRAQNTGTANVDVDGFVLKPGESIDYSHLEPSVVWNSPIVIVVTTGGVLRISRLKYNG